MSDVKQEVLKTHILKSYYTQVVKTFENMIAIEIQMKAQRDTIFFIKKQVKENHRINRECLINLNISK